MLLMHQPSRRFVAVSHRRVRRSCLRPPFLQWSVCADRSAILKVWGVIWLFIAFIFFVLGVMVGILAFKVRRHGEDICCTALYLRAHRDVFCVGIDGSAREGRGALLARAGVEERRGRFAAVVDASHAARRHPVVRIARLAMIGAA